MSFYSPCHFKTLTAFSPFLYCAPGMLAGVPRNVLPSIGFSLEAMVRARNRDYSTDMTVFPGPCKGF